MMLRNFPTFVIVELFLGLVGATLACDMSIPMDLNNSDYYSQKIARYRLGILLIVLVSVGFLIPNCGIAHPVSQQRWQTIASCSWATAAIEKRLYTTENSQHFFVHVRIENLHGWPIGFALDKQERLIFPNQWLASDSKTRIAIDEKRIRQISLSAQQIKKLTDSMKDKLNSTLRFARIKTGQRFDYYISFNNGKSSDLQNLHHQYVIVVMDGYLPLTDGDTVQEMKLDDGQREVCLSAQAIDFARIPSSATIVGCSKHDEAYPIDRKQHGAALSNGQYLDAKAAKIGPISTK